MMKILRFGALATVVMLLLAAVPSHAAPSTKQKPKLDRNLVSALSKERFLPVIIQFKSQPGHADAKMLRRLGFEPPFVRYSVVPAVYARGRPSSIRELASQSRVEYVEYDSKISYALDRAAKAGRTSSAWNATYKLLDSIHTDGITGRGVGVAIVDSGVDGSHPDLLWKPLAERSGKPARMVANLKLVGRDSVELSDGLEIGDFVEANSLAIDMADTDTTGGHGTHVAGIAAGSGAASNGKYTGAAPGANLIGLGAGETLVIHLGLAAFDWIHRNHKAFNIRVVNNSWGGAGDWDAERSVTKAARRLVNEDGLVVVFAAGNSGGSGGDIQTNVWGNIPEIIQVANYYDRSGWLDSSSSRGDKTLERTWPHLAAPGTEVISTAATGKPVTYFGSGQDALINLLLRYGEPNVVPAPIPEPVEANVAGHEVVAGNYASFTGTSMAAPFVAGVVALMLEANPALDPPTVRQILRDTADMPKGRAYETDGYAIGRGVVDAAEAVAVSLRLRENRSYDDAVRSALVEGANPTRINMRLPRMVDLIQPTEGSSSSGSLNVVGRYSDGPITRAEIPLAPLPPSPVTAQPAIYHRGFGPANSPLTVEPFLFTGGHTVVPGENVVLRLLAISSNKSSVSLEFGRFSVEHRILAGDSSFAGPFAAQVTQTASGELQSSSPWSVPIDAPPGNYIFEGTVTLESGRSFVAARLPFTIGRTQFAPSSRSAFLRIPRVDLEGPRTTRQAITLLQDDFEEGQRDWEIEQDSSDPRGILTEWVLVNADQAIVMAEPHSGSHAFYVGHRPGAENANGYYYEDMADTSLVSPEIDLTSVASSTLSYQRLGDSERDYDFLRVFVAKSGSSNWTKIDEVSGDDYFSEWNESIVSLSDFVGTKVRIRFQFVSDDATPGTFGGWYVDDVKVVGEQGSPRITIAPKLNASISRGVGDLETTFSISAASNSAIERLELDFGDGSDVFIATGTAVADHQYRAGQWIAKLSAFAGGSSQAVTLPIDVARPGRIEVKIADRMWIDAGSARAGNFTHSFDLAGLNVGETTLQARSCDQDAICVFDRLRILIGTTDTEGDAKPASARRVLVRSNELIAEHTEEATLGGELSAPVTRPKVKPATPPQVTLGRTREQVPPAAVGAALVLLAIGAAGIGFTLGRTRIGSK